MIVLEIFKIDLNSNLKVRLLNKESLKIPRLHTSRYVTEYIMYFILNGQLKLIQNGKELTLYPGDIYFFDKGDYHKPIESCNCEYYYLHFETDSISKTDMSSEQYNRSILEKKKRCLKLDMRSLECYDYCNVYIKRLYRTGQKGCFNYLVNVLKNNCLTADAKNPDKRLEISYAVQSILFKLEDAELYIKNDKQYRTVRQITEYIEKNYITLKSGKELEEYFYLNFDYLNRIFKKVMGISVIKYRNKVRINEAKTLLTITDMSVNEIASAIGFNDIYYFSRVFKNYEGITPSHFRKKGEENGIQHIS